MYYGGVRAVCGYGCETEPAVERLRRAQCCQLAVYARFGQCAGGDKLVQAAKERYHRRAVAFHGAAEARYFGGVLHGFQFFGYRGRNDAAVAGGSSLQCTVALVAQQHGRCLVGGKGRGCGSVGLHGHSRVGQVLPHCGRQLGVVCKERAPARGEQQVGHEHRVAGHVAAAQVERPGYVVECAHKHRPAALFGGFGEYAFYLRGGRFARVFQGVHRNGVIRQGGTVGVDFGKGVVRQVERYAFRHEHGGQLVAECLRHHRAVHTCCAAAFERCGEPFAYAGCAVRSLLHQFVGCAFEGRGGGYEVARVGPQGGFVECDNGCSGRAVEACYPCARLPVLRRVFAHVRVGCRDYER